MLRLCLAFGLGLFILSCEEEKAMSGTDRQFKWEWPGDRNPDSRILVRVDAIRDGGSSGSPSLAGYLPDPVILSATVVAGDQSWVGRSLSIRLPRPELKGATSGGLAGLGLIGGDICICIVSAPDGLAGDAASQWLSAMPCGE